MLYALLAVLVTGLVVFFVLARRLAKQLRFPAHEREVTLLALPTTGHFAALVHHPPVGAARRAPPVIVCHGMGVNHLSMDALDDGTGSPRLSLVRALATAGFDVWALELRGRGHATVPRRARWTIDDQVREDVPAAIAAVLSKTKSDEVWWVGHSKGSMVQLLFQATGHALASKVTALVAIGTPGTLRFQRGLLRWTVPFARALVAIIGDVPLSKLMPLLASIAGLARVLGRPVDRLMAENDARSLARMFASIFADVNRGVLDQALRWVRRPDGALTSMKGEKYEDGYSKLTMPMLLMAGSADHLAPPESVAWVRDRVSSKDVSFEILGRAQGASHDYGHGDLVLGARAPDEVFPRVIAWLGARAT